jgi:hypothetical protein
MALPTPEVPPVTRQVLAFIDPVSASLIIRSNSQGLS